MGSPPPPAAHGVGLGAPPNMPGLPPPPTGIGNMPTGDASTSKKMVADTSITSLRELSGQMPSLKPQIDALIDQIKAGTQMPAPAAPPTAAALPGAPQPESVSLEDSGGPGSA